MKNSLLSFLVTILSFSGILVSCNKDESISGKAYLHIRLTDAPANYDAVYIDIQGVEITGQAGTNVQLNVNSGIYNLLDFVNGADTLLASGGIAAGKIEQIRLILGNNNSVVVGGVSYPLSTPSAQQSGLKIQVHESLTAGVSYMILLDFDALQSVVNQGNGGYSLKPVIRILNSAALNGSITGNIIPASAICSITADNNAGQIFSSFSDSSGGFLIPGLPAGTYSVVVIPPAPFITDTFNNVVVSNGQLTDIGSVNL